MAAQRRSFCFGIPFSTCRFPSFQLIRSLNWSSHNTMGFNLHFPHLSHVQVSFGTFLRVRRRSIESTLWKFFSRLCNDQVDF